MQFLIYFTLCVPTIFLLFHLSVCFECRLSIEYEDRDEMIVAHMVDGVDAFIKVPQGWPIADSALKLLSLKGSSQSSKEVTLSFICKVEVSH